MDATIADPAIKAYLKEIHTRLDEAARIAKAADACAEAGSPTRPCMSRSISSNSVTRRRVCSMPRA